MPKLNEYGTWDEESMSNDLGKKEGFFENVIEPFHNSESAGATLFSLNLDKVKFKGRKDEEFFLKCLDNGMGMNITETNDFSKINKDIYNKRTYTKSKKSKITHSFGGRGSKEFMSAVYNGLVCIFTSSRKSKKLILIKYDTKKPWGVKSMNPKIFEIKDIDNISDDEESSFDHRQYLYFEHNNADIKKIIDKSGFLIFGKIKTHFIKYLKTDINSLVEKFQKYCNKNLKNCQVNINDIRIKYKPPEYGGKYTSSTQMTLWKSQKTKKYKLTCTYNGEVKHLSCQRNGNLKWKFFDKSSYENITDFIREDKFNYSYFENKFNNKLLEEEKNDNTRRDNLISKINYERHGTLLMSQHPRTRESSGDNWVRDVLGFFSTTYIWDNDFYMDKILQINADKLNPNTSKTKKFLTKESYALLTNNRLNCLFIKDNKYLLLESYKYIIDKNNNKSNKYKFLKENFKNLKKEMINSHKLEKWLKSYELSIHKKNIRIHKNLINVVDYGVEVALKWGRKSTETIEDMENYMSYPYFERDNAIKCAMKIAKEVKEKSDKIITWSKISMKYKKKVQSLSFYYKINTPIDTSTNAWEFDDEKLMFEGEIGYTSQAVRKRHSNSNIQYTTYINSEGSRACGGKGNKILVEKKVISSLKKIKGLEFGTADSPGSTEKFRFPIEQFTRVLNKIIDNVKPYQEEDNIFTRIE